ncbi:MAG: glycosyltransferase, partial [Acidimicrobiales bacterium]
RRFGGSRLALEAANLRVFTRNALGPRRSLAYHSVQALGSGTQFVAARISGNQDDAAYWKTWLKANLGLTPLPFVGHLADGENDDPGVGSDAPPDCPAVSVVVPTRGRADRLVRLVEALEAQTIPKDRFEVVIVDDASPDHTAEVLESIADQTPLRLSVMHQSERRGPAAARNVAWRSAHAPIVAFTDDDCVPDPDWLRAGLEAMDGNRRVVVGRTTPPPDQIHLAQDPFSRVMSVDSSRFFETCNVFYRRVDLAAVGGFDERFRQPSGEDTHLGLAVTESGIEAVFAPDALVLHDVRPGSLGDTLRETLRWKDLPLVLSGRRHARPGRAHRLLFWKPTHPSAILAGAGLLVALRHRGGLLLVLPWVRHRLFVTPTCPDPVRRVTTLPGALAVDLCEVAVMVQGSIHHKTLLL